MNSSSPDFVPSAIRSKRLCYSIPAVTIALLLGLFSGQSAKAASDSWNVDADGDWNTNANWLSGTQVPGSTSSTTNTDIATFGLTLTADRVVTVDTDRNIGGITFSSNNTAFKYTLSGGNLLLTNGGVIQVNSTATTGIQADTIDSSIAIQGDGGSGTFTSNGANNPNPTTNRRTLTISGNVTGVSTGANTTTLTLNGSSTSGGFAHTRTPNNFVTGIISDGAGGGKVAVSKSGAGDWTITGANSYTGGTTVSQGFLRAQAIGTPNKILSLGTGDVTLSGGTLQLQASVGSGTVITGSGLAGGGNNVVVTANSGLVGIGGTFGNTIQLQNLSIGANTLTLSGNNGGSLQFAGTTTLSGNATFFTDNSNLTLTGNISETGGSRSITKTGSQTLTLRGTNTYTGNSTVSSGTLVLADNAGLKFAVSGNGVSNKITGTGTLKLDGDFTFDLTGAGITFGDSWTIVDVGTLVETFGSTFTVASTLGAFNDLGSGLWSRSENSTTYEFSQLTGVLSVVPEPSTWALLAFSLTTVVVLRRRRA